MLLPGSSLPIPTVFQAPGLPEGLTQIPGFSNLHTRTALISSLLPLPADGEIWLDHSWKISRIRQGKPGIQTFTLESNRPGFQEFQDVSGYLKVTHLLDPIHWIRGNYESGSASLQEKLQSPHNQAFVEAFASFLTGKLREQDFSPHFHLFYGAFTAKADTYAYNISDVYSSYRHCRWFWKGRDEGLFSLGFSEEVPPDVRDALLELPDYLTDDDDSTEASSDSKTTSSNAEIEIEKESEKVELTSIHSASLDDMETDEDDDEDEDTLEDSSDEIDLFAEIRNFPVMIICTESSSGTLDTLLEDHQAVGCRPGTAEWEHKWTAWIFQVIAALCQIQSLFGMTHNDLHTNNIVWSKTDVPYLYYSARDGRLWKIPTFGCIFRIIDFGRSIFRVNGQLFYSDDFAEGNDAADQYNFGPLLDETQKVVEPNPSFDLSRFAVSVFEALFPRPPAEKKDGGILSSETGLLVMETDSDLYNMLWSWMVCDDGKNVLMEPDGRERYPDFTLYKVIAEEVHGAVPKEQIRRPLFDTFRIKKKQLPKQAKVYSLFV